MSDLAGRAVGAVVVWSARHAARADRALRRVVVILAILAIVLGVLGWWAVDRDDPTVELSPLTIAYGTAGMFVFAGSAVEDVPLALSAARLLAPAATAGATVGLLLTAGRDGVSMVAARRSHGHTLLIGPASRVEAHGGRGPRSEVVHADTTPGPGLAGAVRVPFDGSDRCWQAAVSVDGARRVVVATGQDDVNMALLGEIWPRLAAHPELTAAVEVDDRSTALTLSVATAVEAPERHLEIICRDDLQASAAAEIVLDRPGDHWTVVVAGDSPVLELLAGHLVDDLRERYLLLARSRPRLGVVVEDDAMRSALQRRLEDRSHIDLRTFRDLGGLLAWADGPLTAVVDHADRAKSVRWAVELVWARPGSVICMRSDAEYLPLGLRPLNLARLVDAGTLVGPWLRAADRWSGRDREEPMDDDTRREVAARIRAVVAGLLTEAGWSATVGSRADSGEASIGRAALFAAGFDATWTELPDALQHVGIALHPPVRPRSDRTMTDDATPSDDDIERMARAIHAAYLADPVSTGGDLDHPAAMPWDELPDGLKAQNLQQARQHIERADGLGLRIVRLEDAGPGRVVELAEAQVVRLARAEHDRWSRQKRAHGFQWGEVRDESGPPRTHPDLVAWEDLTEAAREKDLGPIRRLPAIFEAVGYGIVRGADGADELP